ncbi:FG-nucleoporin nsp1 [Dimargaris xerosporica]|nr:FG-nucleoporin nsp1 [Dimargaris xerosporica]
MFGSSSSNAGGSGFGASKPTFGSTFQPAATATASSSTAAPSTTASTFGVSAFGSTSASSTAAPSAFGSSTTKATFGAGFAGFGASTDSSKPAVSTGFGSFGASSFGNKDKTAESTAATSGAFKPATGTTTNPSFSFGGTPVTAAPTSTSSTAPSSGFAGFGATTQAGSSFGTPASTSAPTTTSTTTTTGTASLFGGFGVATQAKPTLGSTVTASATTTSNTPAAAATNTSGFGGFGSALASSTAASSSATTTSIAASSSTSTPFAAPSTGLFGAKSSSETPKPTMGFTPATSAGTSSVTTTATALASVASPFALASSTSTTASTSAAMTAAAPSTSTPSASFGTGPTLTTKPAASAALTKPVATDAKSSTATAKAPTTAVKSVPDAAINAVVESLKGKTLDDVVNKWTVQLNDCTREFHRQAVDVAKWDQALLDNGKLISQLYAQTVEAEQTQQMIDQNLEYVQMQQSDLSKTLDEYEKIIFPAYDAARGQPTLNRGADDERERVYRLAENLNQRLENVNDQLTSVVDEINELSGLKSATVVGVGADGGASAGAAQEDTFSQVVQILNAHLTSLEWLDQSAQTLRGRIGELSQRRAQEQQALTQRQSTFGGRVADPRRVTSSSSGIPTQPIISPPMSSPYRAADSLGSALASTSALGRHGSSPAVGGGMAQPVFGSQTPLSTYASRHAWAGSQPATAAPQGSITQGVQPKPTSFGFGTPTPTTANNNPWGR